MKHFKFSTPDVSSKAQWSFERDFRETMSRVGGKNARRWKFQSKWHQNGGENDKNEREKGEVFLVDEWAKLKRERGSCACIFAIVMCSIMLHVHKILCFVPNPKIYFFRDTREWEKVHRPSVCIAMYNDTSSLALIRFRLWEMQH